MIALGVASLGIATAIRHRTELSVLLGAPVHHALVGTLAVGAAATLAALREPPRTGLAWRQLLYATVIFAAAYHAIAQPFWRVYFDVGAGLAAGALGALWLLAPRVAPRIPERARRTLDVGLFQASVLLVGGEILLRIAAAFLPTPLLAQPERDPSSKLELRRKAATGSRLGFAYDSRGFYDAPPVAGEPFAAMIGDSFSVGVVPHDRHFTTVAERIADVPIYNVGYPSIGPHEYNALLRDVVMPLSPDVVAINLFVGNDVLDARAGRPVNRRLRLWFDRDNLLLFQVPRRLAIVARERGGDGAAGAVDADESSPGIIAPADVDAAFPWLVDWRAESPTFSAEAYAALGASIAAGVCSSDATYDALFDALDEAIAIAGDTPLLVVLIPDECQVEDPVWEAAAALVDDPARLDRDRPQREITRFLDRRGVPCLDLLPALRAAPLFEDGRRHCYHLRDTHLNALGNRIVGAEIARFVTPYLRR